MTTGGCFPSGECECLCHKPGMHVSHIAPCCDQPPYMPPLEDSPAWGDPLGLMWKD